MRRWLLIAALMASGIIAAWGVERFPPPDFTTDYTSPTVVQAAPRAAFLAWVDMAVLLGALIFAVRAVHYRRSRRAMLGLSLFSLLYFGFYRKGCVCAIGSIQNVTQGLFNRDYVVPLVVLFFFALPLIFAMIWGRVFCGGVCPLGAIQDLVLVRAVKVPRWLDQGAGLLRYFYLGVAVLFAATASRYLICEYDPFVGIFRMAGRFPILIWSGAMLALSMVVGRPYCRWLCPYGVLLGWCSRFAQRRVRITRGTCINCHLCTPSCPFGAIRTAPRIEQQP